MLKHLIFSKFTYLDVFVFVVGDEVPPVTFWHGDTVEEAEVGVVSGHVDSVPAVVVEGTEIVGESLEEVPGHDLLVEEVVEVTTEVLGQVVVLEVHPEWVGHTEVVVVGVQADVFHEVVQFVVVLVSWIEAEVGVVGVDVVGFYVVHALARFHAWLVALVASVTLGHLDAVSVTDDFGVEEHVGVDLVDGWELDVFGVRAVDHGRGEGSGEHTGVDVDAGPAGGLVEGVEVLGEVEQTVQHHHLLTVLLLVVSKESITLKETDLVVAEELHDGILEHSNRVRVSVVSSRKY